MYRCLCMHACNFTMYYKDEQTKFLGWGGGRWGANQIPRGGANQFLGVEGNTPFPPEINYSMWQVRIGPGHFSFRLYP